MRSQLELTFVDEFHITTDSTEYRERPYKDEEELELLDYKDSKIKNWFNVLFDNYIQVADYISRR